MANRSLLHRSKLKGFDAWLVNHGWTVVPTKGTWEVLRATKPLRTPLIVYTRKNEGSEHVTVQDSHVYLLRQFIMDTKTDAESGSDEPKSVDACEGCRHKGSYENEIEYGYPSPCTCCKRRCSDNYSKLDDEEEIPW